MRRDLSRDFSAKKYPHVVPILGSRNKERIIENLSTHEIVLTDREFTALDEDLSKIAIYGSRNGVGFNTKYID